MRDGFIGKAHGPEFDPQYLCEKPDIVGILGNPVLGGRGGWIPGAHWLAS